MEAVFIKRLSEKATLPTRGSQDAAGLDLYSAEEVTIPPNGRMTVRTDIAISPPAGTYGRIASRSGLTRDFGIVTLAGVVDADYRGNIFVLLFNFGKEEFKVKEHDRIAQIIFEFYRKAHVIESHELSETERGSKAFGSV
jgi:dUTP pyrophosphatase